LPTAEPALLEEVESASNRGEAEEPASTSRAEQRVAGEKCQLLLLLPWLTLCERLF